MSDAAFYESYDAVELELPSGKVRCKPLTLTQSAKFLRLLVKAGEEGDMAAMLEIMEAFPEAVGAKEAFEGLTPVEFFEAVNRFFVMKPIRKNSRPPAS
jgi:hypothetical protein